MRKLLKPSYFWIGVFFLLIPASCGDETMMENDVTSFVNFQLFNKRVILPTGYTVSKDTFHFSNFTRSGAIQYLGIRNSSEQIPDDWYLMVTKLKYYNTPYPRLGYAFIDANRTDTIAAPYNVYMYVHPNLPPDYDVFWINKGGRFPAGRDSTDGSLGLIASIPQHGNIVVSNAANLLQRNTQNGIIYDDISPYLCDGTLHDLYPKKFPIIKFLRANLPTTPAPTPSASNISVLDFIDPTDLTPCTSSQDCQYGQTCHINSNTCRGLVGKYPAMEPVWPKKAPYISSAEARNGYTWVNNCYYHKSAPNTPIKCDDNYMSLLVYVGDLHQEYSYDFEHGRECFTEKGKELNWALVRPSGMIISKGTIDQTDLELLDGSFFAKPEMVWINSENRWVVSASIHRFVDGAVNAEFDKRVSYSVTLNTDQKSVTISKNPQEWDCTPVQGSKLDPGFGCRIQYATYKDLEAVNPFKESLGWFYAMGYLGESTLGRQGELVTNTNELLPLHTAGNIPPYDLGLPNNRFVYSAQLAVVDKSNLRVNPVTHAYQGENVYPNYIVMEKKTVYSNTNYDQVILSFISYSNNFGKYLTSLSLTGSNFFRSSTNVLQAIGSESSDKSFVAAFMAEDGRHKFNWTPTGCQYCTDLDGDGYGVNCDYGQDCNDNDSLSNPGSHSYCQVYVNGVLNSCYDQDGDGRFGNTTSCPMGVDVNDSNANVWTSLGLQCVDNDQDGFGQNCDRGKDCDDSDPYNQPQGNCSYHIDRNDRDGDKHVPINPLLSTNADDYCDAPMNYIFLSNAFYDQIF